MLILEDNCKMPLQHHLLLQVEPLVQVKEVLKLQLRMMEVHRLVLMVVEQDKDLKLELELELQMQQ